MVGVLEPIPIDTEGQLYLNPSPQPLCEATSILILQMMKQV